jgi:sulfite exporter TauE/SafE/plastocyanin domain-containing protein/copper chaperone CopZ
MDNKKERIKVYNMTCTSCEKRVETAVKKLDGIADAKADYSGQYVDVEYDPTTCNSAKIKDAVKGAGYTTEHSGTGSFNIIGIAVIAIAIILLGANTQGFDMNSMLSGATYLVLFIVGLLTSIHCLGMCGGIMLSQSISDESTNKLKSIKPTLLYNAGRVISYTILGGIVGALGSVISLSIGFKAGLQVVAGLFMIIMGLNMTGFGLFRKIHLTLPWSSCSMKKKARTPFIVGILNGFMPCGPLQTMQLFALGTGSMAKGALSMFIFALGTVPLMLTFGAVSGLLSKGYTKKLLKFSGIFVIVLGLIMGSRGAALAGVSLPSLSQLNPISAAAGTSGANVAKATIKDGAQTINMTADGRGYTPNAFYVQKGIPVKWIIDGKQLTSCNSTIVVPSLNKQQTLKSGENVIEFTPDGKDINFSCWMGMIRGVIKVVDKLDTVDTSKADSSLPQAGSGGSCCSGGAIPPAQQSQSIYGNDLSKTATETLVHKALVIGQNQSTTIKGIGYEFDPLIVVVEKGIKAKFTFDLSAFDNAEGKYVVVPATSSDATTSIDGKKGINTLEYTFNKTGGYGIIKDNNVLGIIEVVDNIKTADLETIRSKYLK